MTYVEYSWINYANQVNNKLCYKGYYLYYLSIFTATVNSNDYTDKNYFV